MNRLQEKYIKVIIPAMQEKFGYKNKMAVPKMKKVTINVGIPSAKRDDQYVELIENTLTRISGQKPVFTKARQAIAGFKIRLGQVIGAKVTLRGNRMYDFVDKMVSIAFPRVRDFRGINPKSVDKHGNLNVGFKEHLIFGEINPDEVGSVHGVQVTITTNSKTHNEGLEFFTLLGLPFKK